jgi:hypothetical protein
MNPLDKKLYELFSDKTLSEGCLVQLPPQVSHPDDLHSILKINDISKYKDIRKDSKNYCVSYIS